MKLRKFLFGLLLCGTSVYGNEDASEIQESSDPAERWYRIELLIYRQKAVAGGIEEVWPTDISLTYPALWAGLKNADEYIANPQSNPELGKWLGRIQKTPYTPFVLQGESAKTFSRASKQIQRFEGDILFHGVWWQPFIQNDNRESPSILIKAGKQYGNHAELEGSINFKLSRYLHISTNLWLSEFSPTTPEVVPGPWPALPLSPDQPLAPIADPALLGDEAYLPSQVILIKQSRRMRSEETHYIDHPKLGILVRITPPPEKR